MDLRPRHRDRTRFSGFTSSEVEKMEQSLKEKGENSFDPEVCKKLARIFNRSSARAGRPVVKWTEVLDWLQNRHQYKLSQDTSDVPPEKPPVVQEACPKNRENEPSKSLKDMEFEARSSKDDAWYDIDAFLAHRIPASGKAQVRVRFIGFGPEEDEWVDVRKDVRERSIALEDSECDKVQVGEGVLCFQEQNDQARYYDARVTEIQRRLHDIRGCRCRFTVRYNRDETEESVPLKRLCFRPKILGPSGEE